MRYSLPSTNPGLRTIRRWSLTRRLAYDEDLPAHLTKALWRGEADRLLYASTPLQVKERCTVARHDAAAGPLLVKRHTWGGFWRTVRLSWRPAAARHCARIASFLAEQGIPTPRPRAVLEECIGPFGYRSYLVTDYVEGTDLYRYIRYGSPTNAELRHVAQQVAWIWQRLVEIGISHNDTKLENFIVDEKLRVWLIDFEKVRLRGKFHRQRQRQIADVKNFLHIRGWHHRAAARQLFLEEFLRTPFGGWLRGLAADPSQEIDANLSVLVLCNDEGDASAARRAIDSVRDMADEIVLLAPAESSRLDAIERIELCGPNKAAPEWVLVLHSDEAVTPFLAKELQQRISDPQAADAFRLPIDCQFFGRNMPRVVGADAKPIRLFRRERCSYSLASGTLAITVDPERTDDLSGSVEKCVSPNVAEFVDRLNSRTTLAARRRFQEGHRPRLFGTMIRSIRQFLKAYLSEGGIRGGQTGLKIAVLKAFFTWVEEAKLRQMSSEFPVDDSAAFDHHAGQENQQPPLSVQRSKAA
jgi:tRNA A-37 threonylcarbamoyl transferase component Bud32